MGRTMLGGQLPTESLPRIVRASDRPATATRARRRPRKRPPDRIALGGALCSHRIVYHRCSWPLRAPARVARDRRAIVMPPQPVIIDCGEVAAVERDLHRPIEV